MDAWHKNLEIIARGNGSPQARHEDELCWGEAVRDMRPLTWTTGGGHKDIGKEEGELDIEGYLEFLLRKRNKKWEAL